MNRYVKRGWNQKRRLQKDHSKDIERSLGMKIAVSKFASSNVERFDYNSAASTLTVQFNVNRKDHDKRLKKIGKPS
jgi:hypothetical protein